MMSQSKPAAACGSLYSVGLSEAEKNTIVNKHNALRRRVALGQEIRGQPGPQPPAVSMPNLVRHNALIYYCIKLK